MPGICRIGVVKLGGPGETTDMSVWVSVSAVRRRVTVSIVLAIVSVVAVLASPTSAGVRDCKDSSLQPSVEEARLDRPLPEASDPMPPQLIEGAGFTALAGQFAVDLCEATTPQSAEGLVRQYGEKLWQAAVDRVQGPADSRPGALPVDDDRPLYWTRLSLARTLRQWQPSFPADAADRAAWQKSLEYTSRGLTTSDFTPEPGVRQLFVSGFDPFGLDSELRTANPSGASALHLDARVLSVNGIRVQVQAVVLPVRYPDFDEGIVEDAFGPHVRSGPQRADLVSTTSQGRSGRFDLEVFNGRRRSTTYPDNLDGWGGGTWTEPRVHPGVGPGPEFVRSTLPIADMQAAGAAGPFPVNVNTAVAEIPAGATDPVSRPDGPTEGSIAVEGGGGGYLSNESAYRATLLLAGQATVSTPPPAPLGGHLHLPVMFFGSDNQTEITDPEFEKNRADIVNETQSILLAGVGGELRSGEQP
jgi:hypothetical protein